MYAQGFQLWQKDTGNRASAVLWNAMSRLIVAVVFLASVALGERPFLSGNGGKAEVALQPDTKLGNTSVNRISNVTSAVPKDMAKDPAMVQQQTEAGKGGQVMLLGYFAAICFVVLCISVMYYPMGFSVVFQIVLYICALTFVKLSVKTVFVTYSFFYPKFLTALHLGVSSIAGFMLMGYRSMMDGRPFVVPSTAEFAMGIMPIAGAFALSIGSENSALVFCSAAFSEVVGSTNPVASALLTWVLRMPFHVKLLLPIGVVVIGCIVSVTGELKFSLVGTLLLLLSTVCRAFKSVMQQKLMTGTTKEKFEPVSMLAWTCLASLLLMAVYAMASEGTAPFLELASADNYKGLYSAIAISCTLAVVLNLSALFVVKQIGAVGMQIVAQMKSALIVIGGIALLNESFTTREFIGFGAVLAGVYWYSSMKMGLDPNAKGH